MRPPAGPIPHSDRGSQYCPTGHQAELERHGILAAMSGKANRHDNAIVETFFKTLKSGLVRRTLFHTRHQAHQARQAIGRDIDGSTIPSGAIPPSISQARLSAKTMPPISQCLSTKARQVHAPMESFFGTLKTELVHQPDPPDRNTAWRDLFAYIEGYHNRQPSHSAIGYLTPKQADMKSA
jgi:transposase InsO family protein